MSGSVEVSQEISESVRPKREKVPTDEGQARDDASEEGALADGIGARQLHAAQGTRQHSLVVAEVRDVSRVSTLAEHGVARLLQQRAERAPVLCVMHSYRRRRRHPSITQARSARPEEEGEARAQAQPQQHI